MNADEVRQMIEAEIGDDWQRENDHGVDLRRSLIMPTKESFKDTFNPGRTIELWRVLEEDPEGRSGYKIVFDEKDRVFGLAVNGEDLPVLIGFYGTFLETLDGM